MENSNTPAQSVANPPAAAEPSPAELQAKIAELEKQSEGRLRDLQNERAKRQELEAKIPAPAPSAPVQPDVVQDELGKVLNPYLAPVMERVKKAEAFVANTYRDKALEHLAAKTGKSKETVITDKDLDNKLTDIVKRYGLVGNVYDVTVRAVEIMDLENLKTKEAERARVASASQDSSLPSGTHQTPSSSSGKEFSQEDFESMSLQEYSKLADNGTFFQNKEGKVVFTPNSK